MTKYFIGFLLNKFNLILYRLQRQNANQKEYATQGEDLELREIQKYIFFLNQKINLPKFKITFVSESKRATYQNHMNSVKKKVVLSVKPGIDVKRNSGGYNPWQGYEHLEPEGQVSFG